jgi:hypothetical protein
MRWTDIILIDYQFSFKRRTDEKSGPTSFFGLIPDDCDPLESRGPRFSKKQARSPSGLLRAHRRAEARRTTDCSSAASECPRKLSSKDLRPENESFDNDLSIPEDGIGHRRVRRDFSKRYSSYECAENATRNGKGLRA